MQIEYIDLQILAYQKAWDIQKKYFNQAIADKTQNLPTRNYLLLCEHPPVFTLGKRANIANLLVSQARLEAEGIEIHQVERGGDITFHGLGQCVGYPILDLQNFGIGIRQYVWQIEEVVIRLVADYGIEAGRIEGASGVWVAGKRKICALGIKCSSGITMHGFALNVQTDLRYFSYMNPCGITDKYVTSIAQETGKNIDMNEIKTKIKAIFESVFVSME